MRRSRRPSWRQLLGDVKTLYHTTSAERLPSIMARGLDPKTAGPTRSLARRWIYLAIDKGQSKAYDAFFPNQDVVLLGIDVDAIDKSLLGPDDQDLSDILEQRGDRRDWSDVDWLESLHLSGQATYDGVIPPGAIRILERWHSGD